ncbi:hypothetical protein AGMMS50267_09750 [Spirochaetia bacterium]|nr:hypothetical protein AGMMS50267_09750 [Spirochaetia bacterium]
MGDVVKSINSFLQDYSGIFTSLGVIGVCFAALSKRFKNWIFNDIYSRLDKIENNDLQHNEVFHEYSGKMIGLILDAVMSNAAKASKEEIFARRTRIDEEHAKALDDLLRAQTDRKGRK